MPKENFIAGENDLILVTGASGFIGSKVVECLLDRGFQNLRCFTRSSGATAQLKTIVGKHPGARVEFLSGNLLSREDCIAAAKNVLVIFHLAAGTGQKSYADAFMNSVVTTRNLLEATVKHGCLKRFVSVSSFAVYSNVNKPQGRTLDESCPLEEHPELRGDAYCFAKAEQEKIVNEYCEKFLIPRVTLRPGYVYGPGKHSLSDRVGIDTFGFFLHLGGSNPIPCTYIDNCAEAIALAGLKECVEGEVFNVVDDDLPSSRQFLRLYKKNVKRLTSFYLPHFMSYAFCYWWERYSAWSEDQLPPVFNRKRWNAAWRKTYYTNQKLKRLLGWTPRVSTSEGLSRYFEGCRGGLTDA